ncbi:SMI1/KNR4 family protein [Saccharopolyspora sp. SCSIO 74807]|uniref:SMI1/KNR4 family protein n=1 Tax=Saccharopolyspora sp. SCSIO 74807 TaxID=3118084 RepID=UPI0030D0AFC7
MTALDQIKSIVPPPAEPSVAVSDWDQVEGELGLRLPSDYKGLVADYGAGSFDEFLLVLQPYEENSNIDLLTQRSVRLDALRSLSEQGESVPFDLEPGNEELLPWGITDNGDVCYWMTEPDKDPDEWTVAVNEERGPHWEQFDGSVTEFLVAVFSRTLAVPIFPSDFPSEESEFEALT